MHLLSGLAAVDTKKHVLKKHSLLVTSRRRRRKAQAELCLAFDRRNSEYRLENSMSPSCLRRSGPADSSSCLETHSTV
ncbi:hypothetical protein EYF80_045308 [Liparis tanakae]|uniref:Uncharacterized protein n=1 Tax=Liparis tanakae TaxID=230148 RepID=A0A4Z2FTD8_9TELE|nr:hypothetical protein EYF80_045308 [Liparis tanakae]